MSGKPQYELPPDDELVALIIRSGGYAAAARHLPISERGLRSRIRGMERLQEVQDGLRTGYVDTSEPAAQAAAQRQQLRSLIARRGHTVEELADALDVSPKRVRELLAVLRVEGFRVPEEDEPGGIRLQRIAPDKLNLHRSLLEGRDLTIGLVSDTHLSSREEAVPELNLAYDVFAERGITEVWHAGDFTAGVDIFRTQASELKHHTFEQQVEYLVDAYPQRPGITTRGISGNHDIEGGFGKIGANPVAAMAARRDDIEFLGDYSAWVELPGGAWVHLLHGKGGMSYAYSYKAQKLADSYPAGRKPALLCVGHWHVRGNIEARGIQVVWPGCFEWQSPFMTRLGLQPAVGFHILHLTIGADGSLVRFVPEWFRFWEGRVVQ